MDPQKPELTEGIILKVIDFRDYDQIMTVFTPEMGIVKWIIKKRKPATGKTLQKLSPITRAEFIYTYTKSDLWKCKEVIILDTYVKLREKYAWIETAGKLIHAVLISQTNHKPAPRLYQLLNYTLEKIPLVANPKLLEISFMLKILKNEGLMNTELTCSHCSKELQALHIAENEYFCGAHAPLGALELDYNEILAYLQLAACQTLSELQAIEMPESLPKKVEILFSAALEHN
jgi:DNA repair protein RecO (recombination protein O)